MKWVVFSIIGINLCIFLYITAENRYLAYGLDTVRELGKANRIRLIQKFPDYSPERLGLPLVGALSAGILGLDTANTLIIPILLYLFGGSLIWFLVFYRLTRDYLLSVSAVFLNLIMYPPGYLNANQFFGTLLFPLRLLIRHQPVVVVILLAIFCQFTYPILALATDVFFLGYFLWLWWYKGERPKIGRVIIGAQLLSIVCLYLFFYWYHHEWVLPDTFFTTIYLLSMTPLAIDWVSAAIILFYSLHLLFFIPNLPRFTRNLHQIVVSRFRGATTLSSTLTLVMIVLIIVPWFPLINSEFLSTNLIQYVRFLAACICLLYLKKRPAHPLFLYTALFVAIYALIMILVTDGNPNHYLVQQNRFTILISPLTILLILSALKQYRLQAVPLYILLISLMQLTPYTTYYQEYFANKADKDVIEAMRWLNSQPDPYSVLFDSPYFAQNTLTGHEKYEGLYYGASKVPWADQQRIGKCDPNSATCVELALNYAKTHQIKYILLKNIDTLPTLYLYQRVGEIIYDKKVKIIRLN